MSAAARRTLTAKAAALAPLRPTEQQILDRRRCDGAKALCGRNEVIAGNIRSCACRVLAACCQAEEPSVSCVPKGQRAKRLSRRTWRRLDSGPVRHENIVLSYASLARTETATRAGFHAPKRRLAETRSASTTTGAGPSQRLQEGRITRVSLLAPSIDLHPAAGR